MAIPTSKQNQVEPAKAKLVNTLPDLGDAELGEMYVLLADGRIYIRTTSGWGYLDDALVASTGAKP